MKNVITIRDMIEDLGISMNGKNIILHIIDNFKKIKEECFSEQLRDFPIDYYWNCWFPFDTVKLYKYFDKLYNEHKTKYMNHEGALEYISHAICHLLRDNYVIESKEKIEERINKIEIELEELKKNLEENK